MCLDVNTTPLELTNLWEDFDINTVVHKVVPGDITALKTNSFHLDFLM